MLLFKVLMVVIGGATGLTFASENCYYGSKSTFRPLVYNEDGSELLIPHENKLIISHEQMVLMTCKQFKFEGRLEHTLELTCHHGKLRDRQLNEMTDGLLCKQRVIQLHSAITPKCSDTMAQYVIIEEEMSHSIVAETCYDRAQNIPVFSHFILSKRWEYLTSVPGSTKGKFLSTADILSVYRSDKLNEKVTKILGVGHSYKSRTLHPASLIPKQLVHPQLADISRRAHNLISLWDGVLNGNYENTIKDVKSLSTADRSFDIYMGTLNQLDMLDTNTQNVNVYLRNWNNVMSFPVPKYVWTIVYEMSTQKSVVFLTLNKVDPEHVDEPMCNNVCPQLTWISNLRKDDNYMNASMGVTQCCDLNEFREYLERAPAIDDLLVKEGDEGLLME